MSSNTSEYQEHLELIREIEYFSGISLEAQKVLAYLCVREFFNKGDIVFTKDEIDLSAYYLINGKLEIFNEESESPIGSFNSGDFIGALSLIGESKRLFTVKASEETDCFRLTKDKFTKIREQFPSITDKFMLVAVESIYSWEKRFIKNISPSCSGCLSTLGLTLI